jgi:hypothetical protein
MTVSHRRRVLGLASVDGNDEEAIVVRIENRSGNAIAEVQSRVKQPVIRWLAATLDGVVASTGAVYGFLRTRFRSLTPGPPPFSSMSSMPPASSAARIFLIVSSRPPNSPSAVSSRAIVGSETPDWRAKSDWDHPRSARAALTCRMVINLAVPRLIEFILTKCRGQFNRIYINKRRRALVHLAYWPEARNGDVEMKPHKSRQNSADRRHFVGGSDARIIMGQDEKASIGVHRRLKNPHEH